MFCNMCGKKIEDNSSFCTWCGAKLDPLPGQTHEVREPVLTPAAQPAQESSTETAQTGFVPNEVKTPQSNTSVPQGSSVQYGRSEGIQFTQASAEAPQPQAKPLGETKPGTVFGAEVPIKDVPEGAGKPRKFYTGAHIALCLVTTGIMAMAAGVFAALYFSAIL